MDELLEQFLIESRDLIAQAGTDFAVLSAAPGERGAIDRAFRAVHTLKGSVAIFGFAPLERVLHSAEDLLEQARKETIVLGEATIAALVSCIDQTDRWIDEIEITGGLGDGAADVADRMVAKLSPGDVSGVRVSAKRLEQGNDAWSADLRQRFQAIIADADRPVTAFRYEPDADCFFRGEDPLAIAMAAPDILVLEVLPAGKGWPSPEEIEPFSCFSIIEGLSGAAPDLVAAAFRLVPGQVRLTTIEPAVRTRQRETKVGGTTRVETARLDALADRLGDLLVAVHGLSPFAQEAEALDRPLGARMRTALIDLERIAADMNRSIGSVRSVPLGPALRRLSRGAREIGESLGKTVQFTIAGQDVEADRQIADGLYEPLLHLVRNAIDHGIEPQSERKAAGKPGSGRVRLALRRDGETIEVLMEDDGRGIDPAGIRALATERGLLDREAAIALSDASALRLIFLPGFSTADKVTEISGRGVGMNAVETAIEALRGTIDIESRVGEGTSFRMRIPANALTTRLLVVEAGGDRYGVALDQVIETVRVERTELHSVGHGLIYVLRGRSVPVLSLAELLGGEDRQSSTAKLLVTGAPGERIALKVDSFGERIDTPVRRPGAMLGAVPGVRGSALLSDGAVLLVLDLTQLAA